MVNPLDIKQTALEIAERFRPERIVLFGSYAYGQPNIDSDVDLLIVVKGKRVHDRAIRIREQIDFPFPVDLIVRSVDEIKRRVGWGDSFLIEIEENGKVLYESTDTGVGEEGGRRLRDRPTRNTRTKIAEPR